MLRAQESIVCDPLRCNMILIDQFVLGFFITTIFKEKIHVSHLALEFLYEKLDHYLQRQNTHMREYFN